MTTRKTLAACVCGIVCGAWNSTMDHIHFNSLTSLAQAQDPQPSMAAIASDVAVLKDKAVDQAHAMMDVEYHFTNLWFAGQAANWPLADFYWKETRSHLQWAVRIIPVRKDNAGQDVKLTEILQAVENSPLKQLQEAIQSQDKGQFENSYRFMLESCYACHKASDKPFLRPRIPEQPASTAINFDPNAQWPK
jgi:hypothetical protein